MNTMETNTIEMACFEVNEHGRLLSGNKRFCRMFGFDESEIQWHYVTDLYRHVKDWENFRTAAEQNSFVIRMKNRKGRSFSCNVVREMIQKPSGEIIFRNTVHRQGEAVDADAVVSTPSSVVFIAKCAHCGEHIRVNSVAETRMRMLCNACAAREYPEAYHAKEARM